jgi:Beta-propeller repeat
MTRMAVLGGRSAGRSKPNQRLLVNFSVRRFVCAALALVAFNRLNAGAEPAQGQRVPEPVSDSGASSQHRAVLENYVKAPLSFEPNGDQANSAVQFVSRGQGYTLLLESGAAVLNLSGRSKDEDLAGPRAMESFRMELAGASPKVQATGLDPQPGIVNYFVGSDPAKWRTGIPTFGKVNFAGVYPDIDVVFYGNQRQLEYDFVVKPGGNPASIAWSFQGARPRLGENGSLELDAPGGELAFLAPVAYQMIDGRRRAVSASYSIEGETARFALGPYDHSTALIIDPVLSYFSYLGGTGNDYIGNSVNQGTGAPSPEPTQAVGIDSLGSLYVAGSTSSTDFPVASAVGTKKTKNPGQSWAFVSKFSPDGSKLLYSTYIGGSAGGNDAAWALAVDSTGNAYVTGAAQTNDFPVTAGAFQTVCAPMWDNLTNAKAASCTSNTQNAFALKLNPTGSKMIYSSFLGGQGGTWGTGIAVDSAGQAYVTGVAQANGCGGPAYLSGAQYGCFPTTSNALISDIGGGNPIDMSFMTVFNSTGSALVYSTLFGDSQGGVSVKGAGCTTDCGAGTYGTAIALDPLGNVYIGGRTVAANMVTTKGAFNTLGSGPIPSTPQILNAPNGYGYVAKFAPVTASGTSLLYSTYFGGEPSTAATSAVWRETQAATYTSLGRRMPPTSPPQPAHTRQPATRRNCPRGVIRKPTSPN